MIPDLAGPAGARDAEWRPTLYEARHRWILLGAVVVILLATLTMAGVLAWLPGPGNEAASVHASNTIPVTADGESVDPARDQSTDSVSVKCVECALVVSTRENVQIMESMDSEAASEVKRARLKVTALNLINNYEVTVRMNDGASHQFMVSNPANWWPGERRLFIEGRNRLSE